MTKAELAKRVGRRRSEVDALSGALASIRAAAAAMGETPSLTALMTFLKSIRGILGG